MLWIDAQYYFPAYESPLSTATHGADLSWLIALVVGAGLYWALSRRSIPRERASIQLTEAEA